MSPTRRTNVISLVVLTDDDARNVTPQLIAAMAGGLGGRQYLLVAVPELPGHTLMDLPASGLFRPGPLAIHKTIRKASLFLAKGARHEIAQGGKPLLQHLARC